MFARPSSAIFRSASVVEVSFVSKFFLSARGGFGSELVGPLVLEALRTPLRRFFYFLDWCLIDLIGKVFLRLMFTD
jgi:hypothetical protein